MKLLWRLLSAARRCSSGRDSWSEPVVLGLIGLLSLGTLGAAGPRILRPVHPSPRDLRAQFRAQMLADAMVHWQLETGRRCPGRLDALVEAEIVRPIPLDPWGGPYRLTCPESAADSGPIRVVSDGPDRVSGSDDDIEAIVDDWLTDGSGAG